MDTDTLAGVARALLLVPPADFVAERTARQRALRKDDRETAAAVGKLRKPAPAAWVVDLLADDQALDEAVALGPSLREAQERADPQEISTLRRQRASLVAALAQAGADRASDAGHPATPAVLDQVRATIEAAMADPHAGAAVRSGLLVQPLESVGFEPVDLDGALAVPDAVPDAWSGSDAPPIPITAGRRGASRSRRSGPADPPDHDPAAERRAARDVERQARQTSRDVDAALDEVETALEDVAERRGDLDRRRRDLERQLRGLEGEQTDLDAEAERLGRERDDAEQASDRAREDLVAARRRRQALD